ncbi:hypothetical protein F4810DRAFT_482719 [Camillea tinctor]|nr:hypothetical protein F4810DRAFT_482719 [Camillea tinctor]
MKNVSSCKEAWPSYTMYITIHTYIHTYICILYVWGETQVVIHSSLPVGEFSELQKLNSIHLILYLNLHLYYIVELNPHLQVVDPVGIVHDRNPNTDALLIQTAKNRTGKTKLQKYIPKTSKVGETQSGFLSSATEVAPELPSRFRKSSWRSQETNWVKVSQSKVWVG